MVRTEISEDVKNNKNWFFRYMSTKQKHREDTGPLLNREGKLGGSQSKATVCTI